MKKRAIFKLFSNVIPVKGASRSTLCDLQTGRIKLVPNDLYNVLVACEETDPQALMERYGEEDAATIESYFRFLLDEEWGFMCDAPEAFPDLDLSFDMPSRISNAIIDVGSHSQHDYADLIRQLDRLGCQFIQVRAYITQSLSDLRRIFEASENTRIRSLEMLCAFDPDQPIQELKDLLERHKRLHTLVLHGAPRRERIPVRGQKRGLLVLEPERISSHHSCGVVERAQFTALLPAFTEALHFNSCLNRKIAVDEQGSIRNCPSLGSSFGSADRVPLATVAEDPAFQRVWQVTKDQVEVCRDCEFRYVCTDCRAFTVGDHALGKPAKCAYDPYRATWDATVPVAMHV